MAGMFIFEGRLTVGIYLQFLRRELWDQIDDDVPLEKGLWMVSIFNTTECLPHFIRAVKIDLQIPTPYIRMCALHFGCCGRYKGNPDELTRATHWVHRRARVRIEADGNHFDVELRLFPRWVGG
jgi:hypothetical protein